MAQDEPRTPAPTVLGDQEAQALLAALGTAELAAGLLPMLGDYHLVRQILDRASLGIAVLDPELRYRYVNRTLAEINGVAAADHLGKCLEDVVPGIDVAAAETALRSVLADGEPRVHTVEGTTASGPATEPRWWHNAYHRLEGPDGEVVGVVAMVLEITEDRRIRQALARASTRLALLDEAATRIGTTLDVDQTCKELTRLLVPRLADLAVVDVLETDGPPAGARPPAPLRMRRLALSTTGAMVKAGRQIGGPGFQFTAQPSAAAARCLAEQQPVLFNFPTDEELRQGISDAARAARYRRLGLHSAVFVPLTARGQVVGVVVLVRAGDSPGFTPDEVELVAELARRAAASISNAQRYAHEHETALALQRALLAEPMTPHPDVECASRYLPAGASAEVGGDWYDTVALPGGSTLLVVGDVMGHGLDAAATMSEYRTLLRALALQGRRPDEILREAERIVEALEVERVATCLLVLIDPAAGTSSFASAGHLPPLQLEPGRAGRLLDVPVGPPLGTGCGGYLQLTMPYAPGSTLLLYTDGLVERRGTDIEESLAGFAALALDPADPLEHLIDTALTALAAGHGEDDVAVLAARLISPG
ncbi:PAS domain S-box-containing protein [Kitasatospora sp. MAP12-15]|uniref:SpoIIE family protein phosphatase n=1 Tax=unclassified Kitasatospora TaxID=2633591 RepID=UPI002476AFAA|nr:SpoIIE family protein phosphatase [Kitasatospora sp. MAP12-44]MDH6108964.1 PAS domain S-box-containing protein [Kitasatospora sp. MAP12-44]